MTEIDAKGRIFIIALQGALRDAKITAPDAVSFARAVVREAYNNDPSRNMPDFVGRRDE